MLSGIMQASQITFTLIMEGSIFMIPNDPVMLLSFINLKLRDFYPSLEALCEDLDLDAGEIIRRLASIDYRYDAASNRFV